MTDQANIQVSIATIIKGKLTPAIKSNDRDKVREMLLRDKTLTSVKHKDHSLRYDVDVEIDAYKFLGAYIGGITGLHLALLTGHDLIAKDIIERTLRDDLDIPFGGNNTALHLATLLGARDLVKVLLERGASTTAMNTKGFTPLDVVDDPEMRTLYKSVNSPTKYEMAFGNSPTSPELITNL